MSLIFYSHYGTPETPPVPSNYRNRVFDTIAGDFVRWITVDLPDPTGVSYPGPGAFGVDTSDYCVELVPSRTTYLNRVWDTIASTQIWWVSVNPDTTGVSYPGPGVFGVDTTDYCLQKRV